MRTGHFPQQRFMPALCASVIAALTISPVLTATAATKGVVAPKAKLNEDGAKVPPYKQVYVLCIGINDYSNMPRLRFSEKDATDLASALKTDYGFETQTLLGKNANKKSVEASLKAIKKKIKPEDDLIVYFSGHGLTVNTPGKGSYGEFARSGFLMVYPTTDDPADSPKGLERNSINMKSFAQDLIQIDARHRLLILDCCFSGHAASYANVKDVVYGKEMLNRPTVQVMTAGTDKEEALEFEDIRHGVFTYELLQIIKQKEDYTVDEIFFPLRRSVTKRAADRNYRLTPTLRGLVQSEGEFVFIPNEQRDNWMINASKEPPKGGTTRGMSSPVSEKELTSILEDAEAYDPENPTKNGKRDWPETVARMEDRAAVGDERAMAALVRIYGKGISVSENPDEAYKWAREGYDTGKPTGLLGLSQAFKHGYGVEQDEEKADSLMDLFIKEGGLTDVMTLALPLLISKDSDSLKKFGAIAVGVVAAKHLVGGMKGVTNLNVGAKFAKLKNISFGGSKPLGERLDKVETYLEEDDWKKVTKELTKWQKDMIKLSEKTDEMTPEKEELFTPLIAEAETLMFAAESEDEDDVTDSITTCRGWIAKLEVILDREAAEAEAAKAEEDAAKAAAKAEADKIKAAEKAAKAEAKAAAKAAKAAAKAAEEAAEAAAAKAAEVAAE